MKYIKYIFTFLSLILSISYLASCGEAKEKLKVDGYYTCLLSNYSSEKFSKSEVCLPYNEEVQIVTPNYNCIAIFIVKAIYDGKEEIIFYSYDLGDYMEANSKINTGYILKKDKKYTIEINAYGYYYFENAQKRMCFPSDKEVVLNDDVKIILRDSVSDTLYTQVGVRLEKETCSNNYTVYSVKADNIKIKLRDLIFFETLEVELGGYVQPFKKNTITLNPYEKIYYHFKSKTQDYANYKSYFSYRIDNADVKLEVKREVKGKDIGYEPRLNLYEINEVDYEFVFTVFNASNEVKECSFTVDYNCNCAVDNGEEWSFVNRACPIYVNFTPNESGYYYSGNPDISFDKGLGYYSGFIYLEKDVNYNLKLKFNPYNDYSTTKKINIIKVDEDTPYRIMEIEDDMECHISRNVIGEQVVPFGHGNMEIYRNGQTISVIGNASFKKGDLVVYYYGYEGIQEVEYVFTKD